MSLGDILSKSISYPFSDLTKFLIVGLGLVIVDLDAISSEIFGQDSIIVLIAFIIAVLFSFVIAGYSVTVSKKAMDNSNEIPSFDYKNDFIDGVKLFIIETIYFLIPVVVTLVIVYLFGLFGEHWGKITVTLGIWSVVIAILFIVAGIFAVVARARFVVSRSIRDAISMGDVFNDIKRIGIVKIILFLIIAYILMFGIALILGVITVIPVFGTFFVDMLLGGFIFLFISYGIGLLYLE